MNSMPEGINAWVFSKRSKNTADKKPLIELKKIQALGFKLTSQTPNNTKRPQPMPMANETVLPFLYPKYPPTIKNKP